MKQKVAPIHSAFSDLDAFLGADSALASLVREAPDSAGDGAPLQLPICEVIEDPNQPRQLFDDDELKRLADSIREAGVLQPILVNPKNANGHYLILVGARRFRASLLAGKTHIPAYVRASTEPFDDYAQMIENIQRENLKPIEIAGFIQRQLAKHERQSTIARRLGLPREYVVRHRAYIDMPGPVQDAYARGLLEHYNVAYELRCLFDRRPEVVGPWLARQTSLTIATVREFSRAIESSAQEPADGVVVRDEEKLCDGAQLRRAADQVERTSAPETGSVPSNSSAKRTPPALTDAFATGAPDASPSAARPVTSIAVNGVIVMVRVQGRGGQLVLDRISGSDEVLVQYEDEPMLRLVDPATVHLVAVVGA